MKKIILVVFVFLTTTVLGQNKTITGKITGFKNGDKVQLQDAFMMQNIDSAYVVNDTFIMKNKLSDVPKLLYLAMYSNGEYYSQQLFIANENIIISGAKKDFPNDLKISGSEHHNKFMILKNKTKKYDIEREQAFSIIDNEQSDTTKIYKKYRNRIKEIDKITDSINLNFIHNNLNSYWGVLQLFWHKTHYKKEKLQKLYNSLQPKYKNSSYGEDIFNYLEVGEILKEGDLFFDFEANDQYGKNHKFSEFTGKYILLDFTETYCPPCVASMKEIKKVLEDYNDTLTIISFYADKSELIWKEGVERDKPNWITLYDGKGTSGKTLLKYGVDGYPTFFLINPDGKIVTMTSGYSENIIKKMINDFIK